jgi:hypothetical protein
MAAFAKGGGSERRGQAGWRLDSERFRPAPRTCRSLPGHPEPAVRWHSGFRVQMIFVRVGSSEEFDSASPP